MERKKALAVAAASSLVLGSSLVAFAAVGGSTFLGFGSRPHGPGSFAITKTAHTKQSPRVVTKYKDVYDRYIVDTVDNGGAQSAAAPPPATVSPITVSSKDAVSSEDAGNESDSESEQAEPDEAPDTFASTPPTTATPTPTKHHVEVPEDWPAGTPLPPMPANCEQPHLEDNGVWNCQGDD